MSTVNSQRDDVEALIDGHLRLAYGLAARFGNRETVALEDLRQVAAEALVKAANTYDPGRKIPFPAYATPSILGTLKRYFRDNTWGVHVPRGMQERALAITQARDDLTQRMGRSPSPSDLSTHLGEPLEQVVNAIEAVAGYQSVPLDLSDGPELTTEDPAMELAENVQALRPLLAALSDRDRRMLAMRFGEEMTQTEIAAAIGVSQMQVSRLLERCLRQLRAELLCTP
jgi:RNA polymerase sigma-B factor